MHPLILFDANEPGEQEKAEAFGLSQDTPSYDEFVKKQE